MVALLVFLTITISITVDYFIQRRAAKRCAMESGELSANVSKQVSSDVLFAPNHVWLQGENGETRVGIDQLLLMSLGDVDSVKVHPTGNVKEGDLLFTMKRGSRKISLKSPVAGKIKKINSALLENPSDIIANPYKNGWICKVEMETAAETSSVFKSGKQAVAWLQNESQRLVEAVQGLTSSPAMAYMQDGGELFCGYGMALTDEQWDSFVDVISEETN